MKYSTKSRYALRLMVDLTLHGNGDYIALKDISERQNISVKYLEQIVSVLGKAGMLKSVRGPQGGYKLAKDPSEYTAGDILRITEGNLAPIPCLEKRGKTTATEFHNVQPSIFGKGFMMRSTAMLTA